MTTGAITLAALAALYAQCAPDNAPAFDDLAGIAIRESGLRPWALRDDTTGESLFPATRREAEREAARRLALGHTIGAGLFQITHERNWKRHGLTIANAFDPCTNLRAGANHFGENLKDAARQLYNSGRINGAPAYAASVRLHAQSPSVRQAMASLTAEPNSRATGASAAPCIARPPAWAVGLSPRRLDHPSCREGNTE